VVANKEILLKETNKGILLRNVGTKSERTVTALNKFYGLDQAKTMVRIVGDPFVKDSDYNLVNLIVDFVQRLLQPNITLNRNETEERKQKAAEEVKPVLYRIKAGEMLLREGERISEIQLLLLKSLQNELKDENEKIIAKSSGSAVVIFCVLITAYILLHRQDRITEDLNKNLLFMASVGVILCFLAQITGSVSESLPRIEGYAIPSPSIIYGIPIAAGAMVICLFIGFEVAVPFAMVIAICIAVLFNNRLEIFIYFFLSGIMAAHWLQNCKERKVFIKAGLKLGVFNTLLAAAISLFVAEISSLSILWDLIFAFLGGVGSGILAAGIAPLVEIAFNYTTDIKLLELANLDRPILRKLMIEAPGTYHHSVIVGSLVEAAASEIGANPLLAKVCGYYHDIGKIKKPLYFIENQSGGTNKHDGLEPSMSSLILLSHVKEGVEIAKENRLGKGITDAIRQHHGTSLIEFFFEKAKQRKGDDAVKDADFRYPGPKPQTREIGLVMLADVVEAASRTLDNPTPARIQGLVQRLIRKIFSDGQLDNCELTLKDLHSIAKTFNKILNGIHHHRIEYSPPEGSEKQKAKNGYPDRQQTKQIQDSKRDTAKKDDGHLKRLGQS
jgi:putative nucleotidyltransferase with HDIG domain